MTDQEQIDAVNEQDSHLEASGLKMVTSFEGEGGSNRRACLHCPLTGRGAFTSDDPGVSVGVCSACGLPVCSVCANELQDCPLDPADAVKQGL